jgi:hypothetical protein
MTDSDADSGTGRSTRLSVLGWGGLLSLCCLLAVPAGTGAVGGTAAAGATAAVGGGAIQVAVTALVVGVAGAVWRFRSRDAACDA